MVAEVYQERQIGNLGIKPHNPSRERVVWEMRKSETRGRGELGVILLKPGCFSLDSSQPSLIQQSVEDLIAASQLDVIATSCVFLNREQVRKIYSFIFSSRGTPVPVEVQKFREDLETYMADQVFSYLIYGEDAQAKLEVIKQSIRQRTGHVKGSMEVRNAIHVQNRENLATDVEILFLGNKCQPCPKQER